MKDTQKTKDDNKVKMSDWDAENISKILSGHGSWFTAKLIRLVAMRMDSFVMEVDVKRANRIFALLVEKPCVKVGRCHD